MSHYTVQYLDETFHHQEVCTYAANSWDARNNVTEDVPYLQDHPGKVDSIILEGSIFSSIR